MTTTKTVKERWIDVIKLLGGRRVTSAEASRKAIELNLFPEITQKAVLKALQNSFRRAMNEFLPSGVPVGVHSVEYSINEDGEIEDVDVWTQWDLCEFEEWKFSVKQKASGIQGDINKLDKELACGEHRWGEKGVRREIEKDLGIKFSPID